MATMVNVTPRRPSIIGMVIGAALAIVGGWLLYRNFDTLLPLLQLFAGFFLLLFGVGILLGSVARR